jgi:hypothetical protein
MWSRLMTETPGLSRRFFDAFNKRTMVSLVTQCMIKIPNMFKLIIRNKVSALQGRQKPTFIS